MNPRRFQTLGTFELGVRCLPGCRANLSIVNANAYQLTIFAVNIFLQMPVNHNHNSNHFTHLDRPLNVRDAFVALSVVEVRIKYPSTKLEGFK